MRINPDRPIEELRGKNRETVRTRLGNTHCMTRALYQARIARPESMEGASVALRRGWAKCVLDTVFENRTTFIGEESGQIIEHEIRVGAFS